MNENRRQILDMLAKGKLTVDQAERRRLHADRREAVALDVVRTERVAVGEAADHVGGDLAGRSALSGQLLDRREQLRVGRRRERLPREQRPTSLAPFAGRPLPSASERSGAARPGSAPDFADHHAVVPIAFAMIDAVRSSATSAS